MRYVCTRFTYGRACSNAPTSEAQRPQAFEAVSGRDLAPAVSKPAMHAHHHNSTVPIIIDSTYETVVLLVDRMLHRC